MPKRGKRARQTRLGGDDLPQRSDLDIKIYRSTGKVLIAKNVKFKSRVKKLDQALVIHSKKILARKMKAESLFLKRKLDTNFDVGREVAIGSVRIHEILQSGTAVFIDQVGVEIVERPRQRNAALDRDEVQAIPRSPIMDFAVEARRLGVPIEPTTEINQAKQIISVLAKDALDLFGSKELGEEFLTNRDIDGYGNTGLSLLKTRGVSAVFMKLDELRFGAAG